jgi:peptidoglycan-associated lipoprotein
MRSRLVACSFVTVFLTAMLASCSRPKPVIAPEPQDTAAEAPTPATGTEPAAGTLDVLSEPPIAPAQVPESGIASGELPADVEAINRAGYLTDAYFETDKADLRDDTRETLAADAAWLREHPTIKVLIEGHCDERNTAEYNLALGWRRANSAKDYIVSLGVAADRIATISYGEEKPFAAGHDEAAWTQNRRAHFVVTGR